MPEKENPITPKHKIQQFRPLYVNGDGEILVLLKTGRYVPLDECQLDTLKAFGQRLIDAPSLAITPDDTGGLTIKGEQAKKPVKKQARKPEAHGGD